MNKGNASSIDPIEPVMDEIVFCRVTGVSLATARRNRSKRKGCPYVKLGALVRYRPSDVRAFIEQNLRSVEAA